MAVDFFLLWPALEALNGMLRKSRGISSIGSAQKKWQMSRRNKSSTWKVVHTYTYLILPSHVFILLLQNQPTSFFGVSYLTFSGGWSGCFFSHHFWSWGCFPFWGWKKNLPLHPGKQVPWWCTSPRWCRPPIRADSTLSVASSPAPLRQVGVRRRRCFGQDGEGWKVWWIFIKKNWTFA